MLREERAMVRSICGVELRNRNRTEKLSLTLEFSEEIGS